MFPMSTKKVIVEEQNWVNSDSPHRGLDQIFVKPGSSLEAGTNHCDSFIVSTNDYSSNLNSFTRSHIETWDTEKTKAICSLNLEDLENLKLSTRLVQGKLEHPKSASECFQGLNDIFSAFSEKVSSLDAGSVLYDDLVHRNFSNYASTIYSMMDFSLIDNSEVKAYLTETIYDAACLPAMDLSLLPITSTDSAHGCLLMTFMYHMWGMSLMPSSDITGFSEWLSANRAFLLPGDYASLGMMYIHHFQPVIGTTNESLTGIWANEPVPLAQETHFFGACTTLGYSIVHSKEIVWKCFWLNEFNALPHSSFLQMPDCALHASFQVHDCALQSQETISGIIDRMGIYGREVEPGYYRPFRNPRPICDSNGWPLESGALASQARYSRVGRFLFRNPELVERATKKIKFWENELLRRPEKREERIMSLHRRFVQKVSEEKPYSSDNDKSKNPEKQSMGEKIHKNIEKNTNNRYLIWGSLIGGFLLGGISFSYVLSKFKFRSKK